MIQEDNCALYGSIYVASLLKNLIHHCDYYECLYSVSWSAGENNVY